MEEVGVSRRQNSAEAVRKVGRVTGLRVQRDLSRWTKEGNALSYRNAFMGAKKERGTEGSDVQHLFNKHLLKSTQF